MRSITLAALLFLGISSAKAALVETFFLPTTGASVASSAVLDLGTSYSIEVSGTFEIGCIGAFGACPTDAEYYVPSDGANAGIPFDNTGFSNDPNVGTDVGARINGVSIDWGPFQNSRVYSILFVGLGGTISMDYLDTNYGDNVGSLNVSISTLEAVIPIPAAAWLFATAILAMLGFGKRSKRSSL